MFSAKEAREKLTSMEPSDEEKKFLEKAIIEGIQNEDYRVRIPEYPSLAAVRWLRKHGYWVYIDYGAYYISWEK